jgi:hypothetical protein
MSVLAEIFAAQGETPDLAAVQASPADVIAAAAMIGWLSDPDARWIPVAVQGGTDA